MKKHAEVVKILAGLVSDLGTPISVLRDYEALPAFHDENKKIFRLGVYRLCINAIVINLTKYVELWQKYPEVKRDHLAAYDKLINSYISKIHDLKVINFRNDYVAHAQRKKTKQILSDEEVVQFVQQATNGEIENLFSWIYPKNYEHIGVEESLMGVVMLAKNKLLEISSQSAQIVRFAHWDGLKPAP